MLKKLILVVLISLFSSTLFAATIHLVTEENPPFSFKNEKTGQVEGVSVELVKQIFKEAKVKYTLTIEDWNEAYNKALSTKNYAVFSTAKLPERAKKFKWVGPLVINNWVLLAKKDRAIKIDKLNDAKRYIIGGYRDDAKIIYLKSKGFTNFYLVDTDQDNVDSMKEGKIDLWITSLLKGSVAAQQMDPLNLEQVYEIQKIPLYLALNKKTSRLLVKKLNRALIKVKKTISD